MGDGSGASSSSDGLHLTIDQVRRTLSITAASAATGLIGSGTSSSDKAEVFVVPFLSRSPVA